MQNLPILRLSEVYLNAAEAAVKIGGGNVDYAVKYLNDVIKARSVDVNSANVVDAGSITLERVLTERRKEFSQNRLSLRLRLLPLSTPRHNRMFSYRPLLPRSAYL